MHAVTAVAYHKVHRLIRLVLDAVVDGILNLLLKLVFVHIFLNAHTFLVRSLAVYKLANVSKFEIVVCTAQTVYYARRSRFRVK